MKSTLLATVAAATLLPLLPARAAIVYSTLGATYTEDFNSAVGANKLPWLGPAPGNSSGIIGAANASLGSTGATNYGWRNDTASTYPYTDGNFGMVGWHILHPTTIPAPGEGGFGGNQRMRFGTGSSNTGAFYSFGEGGREGERALGVVNSGSLSGNGPSNLPVMMGAVFTNTTGSTLTEFTLSYFGEQWRNGGTGVAETLGFDYSLDATSIHDPAATRIPVTALDFVSPVTTVVAGGAAVAGNTTGRVAIAPVTVTGLNWANGEELWIRWTHFRQPGGTNPPAHGLAIDDLSFSAQGIPEPAASTLAAISLLGAASLRRRN